VKARAPVEKEKVMAYIMNREEWLTKVAKACEPLFPEMKLDNYRVTCGWPSSNGLGRRRRTVGQCFGPTASKAGVYEIFISPTLGTGLEAVGTLMHEMAHVIAGIDAKHGSKFVWVCNRAGITKGNPFSREPGEELNKRLDKLIQGIGNYPHQALTPTSKIVPKPIRNLLLPDGTEITVEGNMVKLVCSCECAAMMSYKHLEKSGYPTCGCGQPMKFREKEEKDGD
jgi:hypothetical protein